VKIFGIGLNKTGTSTLGAAGEMLGLRTKTWDAALFKDTIIDGRRDQLWRIISQFDLFNDFPYPLLFREIDQRFPRSKFILTRRASAEKWIASLKAHAMRSNPSSQTNKIVYGFMFPHGREPEFMEFYERHNENARRYFRGRPDDFLEICWESENDWARLAAFLGVAAPDVSLPHINSGKSKMVNPLRYLQNIYSRIAQNP